MEPGRTLDPNSAAPRRAGSTSLGRALAALEQPGRGTIVLIFVAVALFSFVIYARSVGNEFVWDDPIVIGQQLSAFHTVGEIFFPPPKIPQFGRLYYRPIITLSYVVDRQLDYWFWKNQNFAFHFPVVLFHALNTGLVFLIGRRLFGAVRHGVLAAAGAAVLFAAHPIHTESVCWMAGRSDTLAAVFLLPAFLSWLAWKRRPAGWLFAVLAALLFLGGLLVKENAVGFLGVVLVADILGITGALQDVERGGSAGSSREPGRKVELRRAAAKGKSKGKLLTKGTEAQAPSTSPGAGGFALLKGWALLLGAALVYYAMRSSALAAEPGQLVAQHSDPVTTLLNVLRAVGFYLSKIFVPVNLDAYIPVIPRPGLMLAVGALGLAVSLAAGWLAWRRGEKMILFLGAWFFGALAPSLAIAVYAISEAPVAERYLYLPSVAFCLVAAWVVIVKLPALVPGAGSAAVVTAGVFILAVGLAYAAGTVQRGKVWASDLAFWEDGVAKSPNEGLAHLHLGLANANLGRDREAEKEYLKAIDMGVDYDAEGRSIALNNLGMLYMNEQDLDKADEYFDRSIHMRPDYPTPHYGTGVTALRRGERLLAAEGQQAAGPWFRRSEQYLRRALELNPQYVKAHNQLAFLLINTGRAQEASRHVEEVLRRMASGPEHDFALRLKGAIAREIAGSGRSGAGGGRSGDGTR